MGEMGQSEQVNEEKSGTVKQADAPKPPGLVFQGKMLERAKAKIAEYPQSRSAVMPLAHMYMAAVGHLTDTGMREIARLLRLTPAEVLGTLSFYEMFKMAPKGRYLVSVCTGMPCQLYGARQLLDNLLEHFNVAPHEVTGDNMLSIEEAECQAACGGAPCLEVNYRHFEYLAPDTAAQLIEDIKERGLDTVLYRRGAESAPLPPISAEEIAEGMQPKLLSPKEAVARAKAASAVPASGGGAK